MIGTRHDVEYLKLKFKLFKNERYKVIRKNKN